MLPVLNVLVQSKSASQVSFLMARNAFPFVSSPSRGANASMKFYIACLWNKDFSCPKIETGSECCQKHAPERASRIKKRRATRQLRRHTRSPLAPSFFLHLASSSHLVISFYSTLYFSDNPRLLAAIETNHSH